MTSEQHWNENVVGKINEILRLLFLSVKDKLDARFGCFEVFGIDFLLREDLNPILMEMTSNPSYSTEMEGSCEFLTTLLRDAVTLACDLHEES